MGKILRVLVLDTVKGSHDSYYRPLYGEFFRQLGYEPQFEFPKSEDDVSATLRRQASNIRHLFICDLSLGKRSLPTGHTVVRNIKAAFPEIFCILTSSLDYPIGYISDEVPDLDMFIHKKSFAQRTTEWTRAQREFDRNFRMDVGATFDLGPAIDIARRSSSEVSNIEMGQLEALIRQIAFRGSGLDERLQVDGIDWESPAGGRSSSLVFKATMRTVHGGRAIPAIIKISPRELAEQEYKNYQQFVKWHLSHLVRADVLGYGETKLFGAVAYSFAFGSDGGADSATKYIQEGRYDELMKIITNMFELSNRGWYHPSMVGDETGLVGWYRKRLFDFGPDRARESADELSRSAFDRIIKGMFDGRNVEYGHAVTIGARQYPGHAQLVTRAPDRFKTCIVHGDFNSNNIILAPRKGVAPERFLYIDFQDTGRGHVFFDFVAFETSLRWYYSLDPRLKSVLREGRASGDRLSALEYLDWEHRLAALSPGQRLRRGPKLFRLISEVRYWARENFQDEDWKTYLFATAMYSFRMLRTSPGQSSDIQRARAVAAMIASMNALPESRMS